MTMNAFVVAAIALNTVLSTLILCSALCVLNDMTHKGRFWPRVAFVLLGTAAFASVLAPLYLQRPPTAIELLMVTAVAILRMTGNIKVRAIRHSAAHRIPR